MFKTGILGINARNLLYIRPYNKKKAIRLADDKLKTKHFLSARGISVPRLYGVIRNREDLEKFDFDTLPSSFVLKPNLGSGGRGIIPIVNRKDGYFIKLSGERLTKLDFWDHINDILDGRFSNTNLADTAFFEQRIISDSVIGKYAYSGLPDIRIVVHNLIPVMAMLRLPTKESDGKANLHQGAVGVGIDIATGKTTYIMKGSKIVEEIPGVGRIDKLNIPYWDKILLIASKTQLITNLGYMAVDIAIDKQSGPVLLEINARAGLGVQLANLAPLRRRLERIEGVKVSTPEKGIRIAKDMFGNKIEKEIQHISGKSVIGSEENVDIILPDGTQRVLARINTGKENTALDNDFAKEIGLEIEGQKTVKLKYVLREYRVQTAAILKKLSHKGYQMAIGRRDLADFLIDPTQKRTKVALPKKKEGKKEGISSKKINYYEVDREIVEIDSRLKLLYHLRPVNLEEEKSKVFRDKSYDPQFVYPKMIFDPYELKRRLSKLLLDDSPLGIMFARKREEITSKIDLIEAIDGDQFVTRSIELFGKPSSGTVREARAVLAGAIGDFIGDKPEVPTEEMMKVFEEVLRKYGLPWKVKIKEGMIANCTSGKNNVLFLRKGACVSKKRLRSLIVHEIETHILTAENGKLQPYRIFNRGLANYLKTQEGLAVYNQEYISGEKSLVALSVAAIDIGLENSFSDVFNWLISQGIAGDRAFKIVSKIKRGLSDTSKAGAFTKDLVYFEGAKAISEFVENGGDLKRLYIGKIALEDLDIVEKIPGIVEPKYLPEWM